LVLLQEIYRDARSDECQIRFTAILVMFYPERQCCS